MTGINNGVSPKLTTSPHGLTDGCIFANSQMANEGKLPVITLSHSAFGNSVELFIFHIFDYELSGFE